MVDVIKFHSTQLDIQKRRLENKRFTDLLREQIDHILIKRRHLKCSKDAEANDMIHMGGDHRCVMATFVINTPKKDGSHETDRQARNNKAKQPKTDEQKKSRRRRVYVRK